MLQSSVEIVHREPVRDVAREVALHVGANQPTKIKVRRPTHFDEVVVSAIGGARSPFVEPLSLPSNAGQARSFVKSTLRMLDSRFSTLSVDGAYLDTRPISLNNIAHLMCDIIPTAIYARNSLGQKVTVITHTIVPEMVDLASQFDVPVVVTSKAVVGQRVQIFVTRNLQLYEIERAFDCAATTMLPPQYGAYCFPDSPKGDRLFFARRGARALANADKIEPLLEELGYQKVFLEDYPIPQQLAIATNAKHVVAIHGAAMGFLVAARNLASIIEIFPKHTHHEWFAAQFDESVEYHALVPEFDETIPALGYGEILKHKNGSVHAHVESVMDALASVHKEASVERLRI